MITLLATIFGSGCVRAAALRIALPAQPGPAQPGPADIETGLAWRPLWRNAGWGIGWTPVQAALAAGLVALSPVELLMVTSKSAPLLAVLAAGATVLSLNRIEAIWGHAGDDCVRR